MAGGPRKPEEGVLQWEFVLVLWVGATEEEFSKAKGIFFHIWELTCFSIIVVRVHRTLSHRRSKE